MRSTGVVRCSVNNSYGQCDAPSGPFVEVAAGAYHSLGLRPDGSVPCWGISSPARLQCVNVRSLAVAAGHDHSDSVAIVDTSEPCAEDLNDDQSVDVADLIVVISGWGPCGSPCDEDLKQDGTVGFQDLSQILSAWSIGTN